jgi:hypothetical protein
MAVLSRPGTLLSILLLSGCGGAIAYNALALQKAHHPAPLFGTVVETVPLPAPSPVAIPPARPEPQLNPLTVPEPIARQPTQPAPPSPSRSLPAGAAAPKPAPRGGITDLIRTGEPPTITQPARPAAVPKQVAAGDPIADMIKLGGPVPVPPAPVGRAEPSSAINAAQRALAKLGYPVKADGLWGPGTRQALESFERDRKLPVTGELSVHVMRELATQTGIAIQ